MSPRPSGPLPAGDAGGVVIAGVGGLPSVRRPEPGTTTAGLLARAVQLALADAGLATADVDGFAVASFSLRPDRCIDLAWRLGLRLRWMMEDVLGMNAVLHAVRAIQAGDAEVVVVAGGDCLVGADYGAMVDDFNRVNREYLAPIPVGGPNPLFALVTQDHMASHGFGRERYGQVVVNQRAWAQTNERAAYRAPLTMEDYLAAPLVAPPLTILDCPPIVAAAEALVLTAERAAGGGRRVVRLRAMGSVLNHDDHEGDGTGTGLGLLADGLWEGSGFGPGDVDVVGVYDDYPVMVLAQLEELGLAPGGDASAFLNGPGSSPAVNTSGGLLTSGQPGGGSSTHGLVEAVRQLRHERGDGQVADARTAVVAAYGMFLYRYAACSQAVTLEGADR